MRRALSLSVFYLLPMVFDSILIFYSCFYNEAWFRCGVLGNKKSDCFCNPTFVVDSTGLEPATPTMST